MNTSQVIHPPPDPCVPSPPRLDPTDVLRVVRNAAVSTTTLPCFVLFIVLPLSPLWWKHFCVSYVALFRSQSTPHVFAHNG